VVFFCLYDGTEINQDVLMFDVIRELLRRFSW